MRTGIIDFHTHLFLKNKLNPYIIEFFKNVNPDYLNHVEEFDDPKATTALLRQQGVEYAVLLAEDAPAITNDLSTDDIIEYCRDEPMLIPFASINPNLHRYPAESLKRYLEGHRVKGLKLMPSYQFFYPNEPRLYPLYAQAQASGIPVMFHVGSSIFKGTRLKYCDPIYLDDVAVDFPDLKIVMAHSGRGFWYEQCFFLTSFHKNMYMDISGLPPKNLLKYFPELEKNAEKILFGSDWPAMPSSIKENVAQIKSLPLKDSTIESILYQNAERLLFEN